MSLTFDSSSPLTFSLNDIQPLMLLNYQLVASFNCLLAGKDQNGSLLNVITNQQSKSLLERIQSDTEITKKLDLLAQAYHVPSNDANTPKSEPKEVGPRRGDYNFEEGIFKKRKLSDDKEKDIAVSETSEASTECEFGSGMDHLQKLNKVRRAQKAKSLKIKRKNSEGNEEQQKDISVTHSC